MTRICPICNNEIPDEVAVCPHCGYHALGSTQSFSPLKFNDSANVEREEISQKYDLKIVRGPQTGLDITLSEGTLTVGRDPQCDIFLNDMTVSRKHATIEVGKTGCVIKDDNSFNGVWVNDRNVDVCLLKTGDVIQIGVFCLVYRQR